MFFGAFLGHRDQCDAWRLAVSQHASWLGLCAVEQERPLTDGRAFAFGWIRHARASCMPELIERAGHLVLTTEGPLAPSERAAVEADPWRGAVETIEGNAIRVAVSLESGRARAAVPPTAVEHLYYCADGRGCAMSNDLRLMLRWAGLELDPAGVYGLLQYGATPAPYTLSRTVRRVPGGYALRLGPHGFEGFSQVFHLPPREGQREQPPEEVVRQAMDDVLSALPPSPVLLFSGGTDSGLMAARLAELGRTDALLVNFTQPGPAAESHPARLMAPHIGLEFRQVFLDPQSLGQVLERAAAGYSFPFGDFTLPAMDCYLQAAAPEVQKAGCVVDGTGAGSGFSIGARYGAWRRVYAIPQALRQAGARQYERWKLWRRRSRLEVLGRVLRRSVQMPLVHAATVGQNPLDGIAYRMPAEVRSDLEDAFRTYAEAFGAAGGPPDVMGITEAIHVSASLYAVKTREALRSVGVRCVYPFLEPGMLRAAFALGWDEKCQGGVPKVVLRRLLARRVPAQLAFRPKGPMAFQARWALGHELVQQHLRHVVLSTENPLLDFCDRAVVQEMADLARSGQPMSLGANNFLWTLCFASVWLSQLDGVHLRGGVVA